MMIQAYILALNSTINSTATLIYQTQANITNGYAEFAYLTISSVSNGKTIIYSLVSASNSRYGIR
jgi:hypothetical protein